MDQNGEGGPPIWVRGSIDRIDQHQDGRWRVLDYKTSHKSNDPMKVHLGGWRKGKPLEWKDLQLPLYAHMTQELTGRLGAGAAVPELGYVNLPGDGSPCAMKLVKDWDRAVIEHALDEARRIAGLIRSGRFTKIGPLKYLEPIEKELLGVGLVVPPDLGGDDDDAQGADGGVA